MPVVNQGLCRNVIFPIFMPVFRKSMHIVFIASMYMLLLFGTTAKEFFHAFTGHEDTVHRYHAPGEYSFENEHHHCDFLHYSLPAFENDISYPYVQVLSTIVYKEYRLTDIQLVQREILQTSLRGPPAPIV